MTMQIFFRTLTGRTITLDLSHNHTFSYVKQKLADKMSDGTVKDQYRIMWAGKMMSDEKTLSDMNIQMESTLYMMLYSTKVVTKNNTELWLMATEHSKIKERIFGRFNIPIHRQIVKQDENISTQYHLSINTNDDEFVLFISYNNGMIDVKRFIIIKKDEPLFNIGTHLGFYPPFHKNKKDDLILSKNNDNNTKFFFDVYKTCNDYKDILRPEMLINASITPKPDTSENIYGSSTIELLIYGYIRINSSQLKLFIPQSIIKLCHTFHSKLQDKFLFIINNFGVTKFDVYNGRNSLLKTKTKYVPSKSPFNVCPITNIKIPKDLCTDDMDYNDRWDGVFYCGAEKYIEPDEFYCEEVVDFEFEENNPTEYFHESKLILYKPSESIIETKSDTISEIQAFEIDLPYFPKKIENDDSSTIQNNIDHSILMVKEGEIWRLNLGDTWKRVGDIKLIERYKTALVMDDDNNLFVIGGKDKKTHKESKKVEKIILNSNEVISSLPDIPIATCLQRQAAFISSRNQIIVGNQYKQIGVLDLHQQKWQEYGNNNSYTSSSLSSDNHYFTWIDEDDPDLVFIGKTDKEAVVHWTDIREDRPTWRTLWNSPLGKLVKLPGKDYSWTPYLMFPN